MCNLRHCYCERVFAEIRMKLTTAIQKSNAAFTLLLLLVVVAIIVVLLALLAPALDQAIYQAEMAVCAVRVRGIAEGATLYAAENKRSYPYRQRFQANGNHKTT